MTKLTENAIIDCFLLLLEEKSFDKITVRDICDRCEINRNTFYYHFEDIYAVLDALFEREYDRVSKITDDNLQAEYVSRASFIVEHTKVIKHIYESKQSDIINKYINTISRNFVGKYVRKEAEGYALSDEDMRYICAFYDCALSGLMHKWIELGMPQYEKDISKRFNDAFYTTIQDMIKSCLN